MRNAIAGVILALASFGTAHADPVTSQTAKGQLFSPDRMILHPMDLGAFQGQMRKTVKDTVDQLKSNSQMRKFIEAGYGYYGAIAFPVNGTGNEPPVIMSQLNSPGAAQRSAIEACVANFGGTCAVAALLLPRGYSSRDFTLSQAATTRVVKTWNEGAMPKFLAYSPTTNAWGIAKGPGASARAAVESCKRPDCVVAIADQ